MKPHQLFNGVVEEVYRSRRHTWEVDPITLVAERLNSSCLNEFRPVDSGERSREGILVEGVDISKTEASGVSGKFKGRHTVLMDDRGW